MIINHKCDDHDDTLVVQTAYNTVICMKHGLIYCFVNWPLSES